MSKLGLALVLAAVLGVIGWSSHIAIAGQQAELNGTITVNGESPPLGVGIIARSEDGTECGRTTIDEGGFYQLTLSEECGAGSRIIFTLAATGDRAATEVEIEGGPQMADIVFKELPDESLQAIGLGVTEAEAAAEQVVEEAADEALKEAIDASLLTPKNLFNILLALMVSVTFLLAVIVIVKFLSDARGETGNEMAFWHQIEAMVLMMVIVAVVILGVTDKVDQAGVIAILGAIAGYGAGRSISKV